MTGRVYLDWNATAPLRPEAREAMIAAMDVVGNPSSVHAEGRAAKAIVERARAQVAALVGCEPSEIVFTSGATEAAALVCQPAIHVYPSPVEHDCIMAHARSVPGQGLNAGWADAFQCDGDGIVTLKDGDGPHVDSSWGEQVFAVQAANSETGVCQKETGIRSASVLSDVVQAVFRIDKDWMAAADKCLVSAHKLGGPKGVGALALAARFDELAAATPLKGGGQELGRRSGTENVVGIAGFGAAAEAAERDLRSGVWEEVAALRDQLEETLLNEAPDMIVIGKEVARLPNTSCLAVPGWKAETQVMQMDLAGYAVSAGSACSSGKVKESRVLRAMGFDENTASSAIRVSLGPVTTEAEVMGFAQAWLEHYKRWKQRAA